jgi:hypothetical protein
VIRFGLEQVVLASLAYLIWVVVVPHAWLASRPAAAALFLIGRLWFFRGYERGAAARAVGFALTFYPSVLLLAVSAVVLGGRFFAGQP